jgi:hypothetical protein
MAVMVGKKYMYKTRNRAAMAKIVWIGVKLLKFAWWCIGCLVLCQFIQRSGTRNISCNPVLCRLNELGGHGVLACLSLLSNSSRLL